MGLSTFIFFFLFSAAILSGPYLWNRCSQRLQIDCAACSCGLILHCCLPSNSLRFFFFSTTILSGPYLWNPYSQTPNWVCCLILWSNFALAYHSVRFVSFFFLFFRQDFVRAISLEPLLADTPNWVCCLILQSNCALLLTIQFASLVFFYFRFFPPKFCPGHISGTITRRDSKLSLLLGPAGLILHCCLPSNSLRYFFSLNLFSPRFCSGHRLSLEPLLAKTPNWVCCLILRSNCALLLTIQFASFFFCFLIFVFSAKILSGPYLWNRYSQRLQIECAAWSCGLIVHCCLPSNSLFFFFFFNLFSPRFCPGHRLSLEPLLAETPNWVCCLILRSNFALLLTTQFASLVFFRFFCQDFVRAISLEPLLAETPNWVCCFVLRFNCALLLTIQFTLFFFFGQDFVRAISLEPLLAETPNWVCCLVLRS